ncbi:hypothetical protein [Nitrosopumilus sp. S6]
MTTNYCQKCGGFLAEVVRYTNPQTVQKVCLGCGYRLGGDSKWS